MCVHGGLGRLGSRQVQSSQCNGFPCEGSPCVASWRSSGRCWRGSRAEARLGLRLGITSQAGPEGRAGLPSPPGPTSGAAVSAARQASSCLLGRTPFQEAQPMPPCPANLMHLSLRQVPACWGRNPSLGTRQVLWAQGLFRSSVPTLSSTSMCPWVPGPSAGWRGAGEEHGP